MYPLKNKREKVKKCVASMLICCDNKWFLILSCHLYEK